MSGQLGNNDSLASLLISDRDHATRNDGASQGCTQEINVLQKLVRWQYKMISMAYLIDAVGLNGGVNQLSHEFAFKVLQLLRSFPIAKQT